MANTIKFGDGQWATKEDSILAYNDENANFKPLPFVTSRASTATRVNKAGLLETVASGVPRVDYLDNSKGSYLLEGNSTNLITQSEAFGNSYWTKSGASIEGDASTAGSEKVVNGDFATDTDWDKTSGATIASGQATLTASSANVAIRQTDLWTDNSFSKKTVKIIYEITANTLNAGALRFNGYSTNEITDPYAVLDQSIGVHTFYTYVDGIGTEDALTFWITSSSVSGSISIDNVSVKEVQGFSAPSVDSPLGAFKLVEATGTTFGGNVLRKDVNVLTSTTYTFSIYIRLLTSTQATLYIRDNSSGNSTSKTTVLSTDWQRVEVSRPSGVSTTNFAYYLGNTDGDIELFGAQVEQQSYATSYIPTAGTTISRTADTASKSGISSLINSTEGVLYWCGKSLANDGLNRRISLSDGSGSNRIVISFSSSNNIQIYLVVGGVAEFVPSFVTDITQTMKIALSFALNKLQFWVNGALISEDLSSSIFTENTLNTLNFADGEGSLPFYSKTKDLQVYKTALTDAELATLTTI